MHDLKIRLLTINIRNSRIVGLSWKSRRRPVVEWLETMAPDVLFLQETPSEYLQSLRVLMGDTWDWHSSQDCVVGYRSTDFKPIESVAYTLQGPQNRGLAAVKLETLGGHWFWAASSQLTSGRPDAPYWRGHQVDQILSTFVANELPWVMLGADIKSTRTPPHQGVRKDFQKGGLVHLRGKLRTSELIGEDYNTINGKHQGKWGDDILCGEHVHPYSGRVVFTSKLTDKNGLKVSARIDFRDQRVEAQF